MINPHPVQLVVREQSELAPGNGDIEIVERKGVGHPDTICDALAEELSLALCNHYLEHFGLILHHNVDKVLLRAGSSRPRFGGGEIVAPIDVYFAGRATLAHEGHEVPVAGLAADAAHGWLRRNLHALDSRSHVNLHCLVRPGSRDLVELYMRQARTGVALANDTSCGVGFAPLSALEKTVIAVSERLNAPALTAKCPEIGEDVKVMGVRKGRRVALTVACALVDAHVANLRRYLEIKESVAVLAGEAGRQSTDLDLELAVNTADDPDSGDVYLTVTGTSAEAGDDGQTGRGNRSNGLNTPYRMMTLEAAAGKNPVTHVGKLYNVVASRIAAEVVSEIDPVRDVACALVSRVGARIDEPQIVDLRVRTRDGCALEELTPRLEQIVHAHLEGIHSLWQKIIHREVALF